jgi:hypothetical protein
MKAKILKSFGVASAFIFLAGCIVESVYPYYTVKDLTYEPALLGRWSESATNASEYWNFQKSTGQSYWLTTVDPHDTNQLEAHLFKLKQYEFLDLRTTNEDILKFPLHVVMKISQINPTLKVSLLDYDWLTKLVEKNPGTIRHIVVPENPEDTNSSQMVYLTADTKELQRFILKHVNDTNAFSDTEELTRLP